jgi:hypothetical protein
VPSKSPLSPSVKSVASASKSSSSTSALHLAPFSKCVLTLDGYNYVISKSQNNGGRKSWDLDSTWWNTIPFFPTFVILWDPKYLTLVPYRSRFIIQIHSLVVLFCYFFFNF